MNEEQKSKLVEVTIFWPHFHMKFKSTRERTRRVLDFMLKEASEAEAEIENEKPDSCNQNRELRKSFQRIIDHIQYHQLKHICREIREECEQALALKP